MIRIIAVIIALLGLSHAVFGAWALSSIETITHVFEGAKASGEPMLQQMDIIAWKRNLYATAIISLLIGSTFVISSFGLFRFREWARKLWLAIISIALIFHGAWFLSSAQGSYLKLRNWLEFFLVLAIFTVSWGYFTRSTVREIFTSKG